MKKRVIAALLAVVMLFGMLPMSVFAENGIDTYSSHNSVPLTLTISSYSAVSQRKHRTAYGQFV